MRRKTLGLGTVLMMLGLLVSVFSLPALGTNKPTTPEHNCEAPALQPLSNRQTTPTEPKSCCPDGYRVHLPDPTRAITYTFGKFNPDWSFTVLSPTGLTPGTTYTLFAEVADGYEFASLPDGWVVVTDQPTVAYFNILIIEDACKAKIPGVKAQKVKDTTTTSTIVEEPTTTLPDATTTTIGEATTTTVEATTTTIEEATTTTPVVDSESSTTTTDPGDSTTTTDPGAATTTTFPTVSTLPFGGLPEDSNNLLAAGIAAFCLGVGLLGYSTRHRDDESDNPTERSST